jgi:hypothetical protein
VSEDREPTVNDEPLLPDQTSDDTDAGWGEQPPADDEDVRRLREERPPHYDRDI